MRKELEKAKAIVEALEEFVRKNTRGAKRKRQSKRAWHEQSLLSMSSSSDSESDLELSTSSWSNFLSEDRTKKRKRRKKRTESAIKKAKAQFSGYSFTRISW